MSLHMIMIAALLADPQTTPAKERCEEYRKLLALYCNDAEVTTRRIETAVAGNLEDASGRPMGTDDIFGDLRKLREGATQTLTDLDHAYADWTAGKIDLTAFLDASHTAMDSGARVAFSVACSETYWHFRLLSQEYHKAAAALWAEYQAKCLEEERLHRYGTPKYNEAAAAHRKEYGDRDRVNLNRTVARHGEITRRLADRRRALAVDLWLLVDSHEARGNTSEAARVFRLLREIHDCTYPRKDGDSFNSTLDYILNRERGLYVVPLGSRFNEGMALTMDSVFRAEPLGSLRPVVTVLPPLSVAGTRPEQVARMLSARLKQLYELEAELERIFERLRTLNASEDATPLEVARLRAAGDCFREIYAARAGAVDRRSLAERELLAAKDALNQVRLDFDSAKYRIYFDDQENVVEPRSPGSNSYESALKRLNDALRLRRGALRDESTPPERKKALRDEIIPSYEERIRRLNDGFDRARAPFADVVKSAERRVEQALRDKDAAVPPTFAMVSEAWEAVKGELDTVRASVPDAARRSIPLLPPDVDEKCEPALTAVLKTLTERGAEADARRRENEGALLREVALLRRVDSELVLVGRSVASLRASAVIEAEVLLSSIGAKPEDEVFRALRRTKTDLDSVKEMLEPGEPRLEKLEQLRERLLRDERGKKLVEAAQERLGLVIRTLERVGEAGEIPLAARQTWGDLQDPRTAYKGIVTILKGLDGTAGRVPVAGPIIAQTLGFYAWATENICSRAVEIQDQLIERDIRVLYEDPKPERHLYTMGEIGGAAGENARSRVAAMLQTRRLLFLVRASSLTEAMDLKR
jgi:hypothetical protein